MIYAQDSLLISRGENKLDTADVVKRWRRRPERVPSGRRSGREVILQRAVSEQIASFLATASANQVASGRQLLSSFGRKPREPKTSEAPV